MPKNIINMEQVLLVQENAHVCWRKAAFLAKVHVKNYTPTTLAMVLKEFGSMDVAVAVTVVATLGDSVGGNIDDVEEMCRIISSSKMPAVPVHVDAASGGFIVPFTKPDLSWDFRQNQVAGINVCSHKFGACPPSLGWLMVRKRFCFDSFISNKLHWKCDYAFRILGPCYPYSHRVSSLIDGV